MRMISFVVVLVAWASAHPAQAMEATFEAARPAAAGGIELVESTCTHNVIGEVQVVGVVPRNDYYNRAGLLFRVPEDTRKAGAEAYVVIEHLDLDFGQIELSVSAGANKEHTSARARALAGYTSVGTGKPRRALFQLPPEAFSGAGEQEAYLRVAGLTCLTRMTVKSSLGEGELDAIKAEVPRQVAPRVKLARPMEWVMNVGADVSAPEELPAALERMREYCPLAAALGFNGIESYVRWNFVENVPGQFDWSLYDAVVAEAGKYGLKWLPLLIVGSAYTLPAWYHDSPENVGFVCLEHVQRNNIQSIFCENQTPHVQAFLKAFGAHYEPMGVLLAVRLGPSGNFGESQYPAGGNLGYRGAHEHIHIGWWAGDAYAAPHFQGYLKRRYAAIGDLNKAWGGDYAGFDAIRCFVPQFAESPRQRKDFADWYMGAMSDWCERWALWAHEAMPNTFIFQSAGGWGFVESGTDFTAQAKGMAKVAGGIRTTNESDSFVQNFQETRMMSSAARFYGVGLGAEPAGFNSAKGVASRVFNLIANNGRHLFFYSSAFIGNDQACGKWLTLAPLLDKREAPLIEVAALYPDTLSKLDDGVFRNLHASSFYQRVAALRPALDYDFCSEQMIRDGALARYKVLVFLWSNIVEADVLGLIDAWVRGGGTVIYPVWDRMPLTSVEESTEVYDRWRRGDTGTGKVLLFREDREPPHRYTDRIKSLLLEMSDLDPRTQAMLKAEKPDEVYVSALESGAFAVLNYNDTESTVTIPGKAPIRLGAYDIALVP